MPPSPREVLVGMGSPDDAGAYRLTDDTAIVQTVDFFTPILDDPYAYGQVAAANALSDVYAMGAKPLTALALLAYPTASLAPSVVAQILQGGADKVAEAGAVVLGGHTIDDGEPKFGYAVTGLARPDRLLTKAGARPGDVLMLTKPIGVGVLTTALKNEGLPESALETVSEIMARLNTVGAVLPDLGVRAATDVTGFGLLGHAAEMARESGVGLLIEVERVPLLPAARGYAERDMFPGGTRRNADHVAPVVDFDAGVDPIDRLLLADAVTSGGLLIAASPNKVKAVQAAALAHGAEGTVIGKVSNGVPGRIRVV